MKIAYDAYTIVNTQSAGGKGKQLRTLLGRYSETFQGFAPKEGGGDSSSSIILKGPRKYPIWQQTSLASLLKDYQPDIFLSPNNTAPIFLPKNTRLILVLHDMMMFRPMVGASLRLRALVETWRWLIPLNVRRSSLILTVSEYSRGQILSKFPDAKVKVIPCTVEEELFRADKRIQIGDRDDFLLLVTSIEPHRNIRRLLMAYSAYVRRTGSASVRLRIVGVYRKAREVFAMLPEEHVRSLVTIETFLPDDELQELLRRAKALVMPSIEEGFGIPVLEAMAAGTPVICSSTASLPEVAGSAAAYFDPTDITDMCNVIERVLQNSDMRAELSEKGLVRASAFHPAIIGRQVEALWDSVSALEYSRWP